MEREDRDLQTVLSIDGKGYRMFDKSKATEERTERTTGLDHDPIVAIWTTEFGNFVRAIETVDQR